MRRMTVDEKETFEEGEKYDGGLAKRSRFGREEAKLLGGDDDDHDDDAGDDETPRRCRRST